ncbi:hypothetical protein BJ170DRAFT_731930 [Xylariales sp. AK1849]|nr:hypothetical protein BJ170DRAFT_731930 [Xylariales sp. AK1849]
MQFGKIILLLFVGTMSTVLAGLPRTFELLVYKDLPQKGLTQVGCINAGGNLTMNLRYCLPYNSDPSINPTWMLGHTKCDASSGTLNCWEDTGYASLFTQSGADLSYNDSTAFSQDAWPASGDDTDGVPIRIGSGSNGTLLLQVQAVGG